MDLEEWLFHLNFISMVHYNLYMHPFGWMIISFEFYFNVALQPLHGSVWMNDCFIWMCFSNGGCNNDIFTAYTDLTYWVHVMHICVITIMIISHLNQCILACHLFGIKTLYEPRLSYFQLDHVELNSVKFWLKFEHFHWKKNAFENMVSQMVAILSRPHCVNA